MVKIYQIKVGIKGLQNQMWRRLLVDASTDLYEFHRVVRTSFGWLGQDFEDFSYNNGACEEPPELLDDELLKNQRLETLFHEAKDQVFSIYDFCVDWGYRIELEEIRHEEGGAGRHPLCLGGEKAAPPDGCTGPADYEKVLRILKAPESAEYRTVSSWLPPHYDPEEFDLDFVNHMLRREEWKRHEN